MEQVLAPDDDPGVRDTGTDRQHLVSEEAAVGENSERCRESERRDRPGIVAGHLPDLVARGGGQARHAEMSAQLRPGHLMGAGHQDENERPIPKAEDEGSDKLLWVEASLVSCLLDRPYRTPVDVDAVGDATRVERASGRGGGHGGIVA